MLATPLAAADAEWIVSSGALSALHAAARRRADPPAHAALHAALVAVTAAAPLPAASYQRRELLSAASDGAAPTRLPGAALRVLTEQLRGFVDPAEPARNERASTNSDADDLGTALATAPVAAGTVAAATAAGGEGAGRALLRYLQLLALLMPLRLRDAPTEEASAALAPLLVSLAEDPPPHLGTCLPPRD